MSILFGFHRRGGQALVEYLLIFGFIALIALNIVKGLGTAMSESVGSLGYILTQQLSVGVCNTNCYFGGYKNSTEQ